MPVLTKINTNVIADDAITGDKFAANTYLSNTANQNISGTYSENRLYTSDAYTLSGNATVNSHLTLSSVKPTADVVLTASGAYTITGTGVLSAGTLLAKANTDLTGMTGELGSTVIGAPAITGLGTVISGTIGSGVTFPVGHVLQCQSTQLTVISSVDDAGPGNSSGGKELVGYNVTIKPSSASNKILIQATMGAVSGTHNGINLNLFRDSTWVGMADAISGHFRTNTRHTKNWGGGPVGGNQDHVFGSALSFLDSPATTSAITYKIYMACEGGTGYINRSATDNSSDNYTYTARSSSTITAWEIVA